MSRRDYELIAKTIREEVDHYRKIEGTSPITHRKLVSLFCTAFAADNPRFDPNKFTRACGF